VVVDEPLKVDRWFDRATLGSGVFVLLVLALVGLFLLQRSQDAFSIMGPRFLTTADWSVNTAEPSFGVFSMAVGTVIVSLMAVAMAIPLGVCAALFITQYASDRGRRYLGGVVDLLAAIPSIIFGLWGFAYLSEQILPLTNWLSETFGWIPFLSVDRGAPRSGSMFIASVVLALMVLPVIASVAREVFAQTPPGEREAALALGGTRWGMIRAVVLPYGRGGIVGGSMLALGRALGETMALVLLLPQVPRVATQVLQNGGVTISGFIATHTGGPPLEVSGLMAAGLVLFLLTLLTNLGASLIVSRSRSGVGVEI
jgi:phosphate transport system permease protein